MAVPCSKFATVRWYEKAKKYLFSDISLCFEVFFTENGNKNIKFEKLWIKYVARLELYHSSHYHS